MRSISKSHPTALGAGISGNNRRCTSYDRSTTTKLDYAVNRTYNAGLVRFTQVDPIGMGAVYLGNPQSLNLYAYCFNDPINHTDPDGLDGGVTVAIIVAQAVIGLFRAILGGKKRARTAPIIKQITHRRQGQLTQRTIWIQASIQAGVGAVAAYSDQRVKKGGQQRRRKSEGRAVKLSGSLLTIFNTARDAALKLLDDPDSDCAKFLREYGIDPTKVAEGLRKRIPYDGLKSTNADSFGAITDKVNKLFKTHSPDAANNNSHTRIYYAPTGLTTTILIHEEFHPIMPPLTSDKDIYIQLGGTAEEYESRGIGSKIVNEKLKEGGCV